MPQRLNVHFWMDNNSGWVESDFDGRFETIEQLSEEISRLYRDHSDHSVYRACFPGEGEEWNFVPTMRHPYRFGDSAGNYHQTAAEATVWPVTDLLTRETITQDMCRPLTASERWGCQMTPTAEIHETQEIQNMTTTASASPPPPPATPASLVDISVKRSADSGKLVLSINAKPLHDMMDAVGCRHDGRIYTDAPYMGFSVISGGKLSTKLFLRREYPVQVALSEHFSRPQTMKELRALCESGHGAVQTILEHYQPVDIRYSIQKLMK